MNPRDPLTATVDAEGRLVLPAEVVARLGLVPGTIVSLDEERDSYRLRRPVEQLAKVYVGPMGDMDDGTFDFAPCVACGAGV